MSTVSEPQELVAGDELNILVATKVLGCKGVKRTGLNGSFLVCDCPNKAHADHRDGPCSGDLLNYSGDMYAAWQVVDHVNGENDGAHKFTLAAEHGDWWCRFCDLFYAEGPTPELAICRAALKAIPVEEQRP